MTPIKAQILMEEYALQQGIVPDHVKLMYNVMIADLKSRMALLYHPSLRVDGLGTFYFKHWRINRLISNENRKLQSSQYHKNNKHIVSEIEKQLDACKAMREMLVQAMIKNAARWNKIDNKEHYPSEASYNKGCRCEECKAIRARRKKERIDKLMAVNVKRS